MDGQPTESIEAATAALRAGDWHVARDAYGAALEVGTTGEGLFGLGVALWWLGETEESLRSWEGAYTAFQRQSDHAEAVLAAFYLCLGFRMSLGNDVAANGWLERASSLVEEFELHPLGGGAARARLHRERLGRAVGCGRACPSSGDLGSGVRGSRPPALRDL